MLSGKLLSMLSLLGLVLLVTTVITPVPSEAKTSCSPLLDREVRTLAGEKTVNLCQAYQGKVVLIVNTASKCAYTYQYEGLEALYARYKDQGLVVLGFPSNDFGAQEPGTEKVVKDFCRLTYGVQFPMFNKTRVRANNADPLYRALAKKAGEYPRWNFHKYLLDRNGKLIGSYRSQVEPLGKKLTTAIEKQL